MGQWSVLGQCGVFLKTPHTEQKRILRGRVAFWDSVGVFRKPPHSSIDDPFGQGSVLGQCGDFPKTPTLIQRGSFGAGEHSGTVLGFSENPHTEKKRILYGRGVFWDGVGVF